DMEVRGVRVNTTGGCRCFDPTPRSFHQLPLASMDTMKDSDPMSLPENYLETANLELVEQDLTADPRLRAMAAEILELRHAAGPFMGQIRFESGTFSAQVTGQTVEAISLAFVSHFKAEGAENFLEMNIYDRDDPAEHYT